MAEGDQRMSSAADTLEQRIRERAYHFWEASGRPHGRDDEFWHRARETIAADDRQSRSPAQRRKRARQAQRPGSAKAAAPTSS